MFYKIMFFRVGDGLWHLYNLVKLKYIEPKEMQGVLQRIIKTRPRVRKDNFGSVWFWL
ncbi:MAG: hypothetical protein JXM68_13520 [Sedimentisphaerales bacterium]|nr:hypothetical protein [Sedimentisphaerales bacterium]